MASSVGGDAGEGEWLKVAELRAVAEAQDPHVKVRRLLLFDDSLINSFSSSLILCLTYLSGSLLS